MLRRSFLLMFIAAFVSCSGDFRLKKYVSGSSFDKAGSITSESLDFVFSYKKKGTYADFFNYVYFQGDTVCFSFDFSRDVDKPVTVFFIDKRSGRKKSAERIEAKGSRVYGFSLAGSLLEFYRVKDLSKKQDEMNSIEQPYTLYVEAYSGGKLLTVEKNGKFTVSF